jgi:hypothetical protein
MTNTALIVTVVIIAIVAVAIVGGIFFLKRRTERLRREFGPEYDRAMNESGTRSRAEATLEERRRRVQRLRIKPLSAPDIGRFREAWRRVQARFVDDPQGAVTEADRLLGEVMSARGYPVTDFNQRAADISVDHPRVVENYRAAHDIALRHAQGQANTEDLRQAMIHYRTLFNELVGEYDKGETNLSHAA